MPILKYRVAELADSRMLAIEIATGRALMLTPRPANGEYRLSRGGSLTVRAGRLVSLTPPAICTGYQVELLPGGDARVRRLTVRGWDFAVKSKITGPALLHTAEPFAILDLVSGGLLLARPSGLFGLTTLDGVYRTRIGSGVPVSSGIGGPIYQYADDFAP